MGRTSTASSTEVLAGLVDRVTFHNSENGFCVLRVKARGQRDLITVVGHAAMLYAQAGENLHRLRSVDAHYIGFSDRKFMYGTCRLRAANQRFAVIFFKIF